MAYPTIPSASCTPHVFSSPFILPSTSEILALTAEPVLNYTNPGLGLTPGQPDHGADGVDICNVTVTYTHPGQGDRVTVQTWLPLTTWNGRLQAIGGSGFTTGFGSMTGNSRMAGAVGDGYVATSTDAGTPWIPGQNEVGNPGPWAWVSDGNVNRYNIENFGSTSLLELAIIAKATTEALYDRPADFSYFNGCSHGGRQGLMIAQRFPELFDGIASHAPGIHWPELLPSLQWPYHVMNGLGYYPRKCELDNIVAAAVAACDELDGVEDGIIGYGVDCDFDPFSIVGHEFTCAETGERLTVTNEAATVANETWTGPKSANGDRALWFGLNKQSPIGGLGGQAMTMCSDSGCEPVQDFLGDLWVRYFVAKNESWTNLGPKPAEFESIFHKSVIEWTSTIGTNDADLRRLRDIGTKIVGYHGTADQIIPLASTENYYDSVLSFDPSAADYYRFFPAPAVEHCQGGAHGQPDRTWAALVDWVEKGIAPDQIGMTALDNQGQPRERIMCPYPQLAVLKQGANPNTTSADDWECRDKDYDATSKNYDALRRR